MYIGIFSFRHKSQHYSAGIGECVYGYDFNKIKEYGMNLLKTCNDFSNTFFKIYDEYNEPLWMSSIITDTEENDFYSSNKCVEPNYITINKTINNIKSQTLQQTLPLPLFLYIVYDIGSLDCCYNDYFILNKEEIDLKKSKLTFENATEKDLIQINECKYI